MGRLKQVFESIDETPRAKTCKAMEGLVEEGLEIIEEDADPDVKDAALIAAAQKVEHYEIAAYGTLADWARPLNYKKVLYISRPDAGRKEEATDEKLTELAETLVNSTARNFIKSHQFISLTSHFAVIAACVALPRKAPIFLSLPLIEFGVLMAKHSPFRSSAKPPSDSEAISQHRNWEQEYNFLPNG